MCKCICVLLLIMMRIGWSTLTTLSRRKTIFNSIFYNYSAKSDSLLDRFNTCIEENSVKSYMRFLDMDGTDIYHGQVYYKLGDIYFADKQYQKAINAYSVAVNKKCSQNGLIIKLAEALSEEGEKEEAIAFLESRQGQDDCVRRYLAKLYGEVGNYQQMMVCFLKEFEGNQQGKLLKEEAEIGDKDSFEEVVEKLVKNVDNIQTVLSFKDWCIGKDEVQRGIQMLKTAEEMTHSQAVRFGIAIFLFQTGRIKQAQEKLAQLVESNPKQQLPYLYLGIIYLQQNMFQNAQKLFNTVLQINQKQSVALSSLGLIHLQRKDHQKASQYFRKTLEVNSEDVIALSSLATIQLSQNKVGEAAQNCRRVLEIDPENKIARQTLEVIGNLTGRSWRY